MEEAAKAGNTVGVLPYAAKVLLLAATPDGRARLLKEFGVHFFDRLPYTKQQGTDFDLFLRGATCGVAPHGMAGVFEVDNKEALLNIGFCGGGTGQDVLDHVPVDYVTGTPRLRRLPTSPTPQTPKSTPNP